MLCGPPMSGGVYVHHSVRSVGEAMSEVEPYLAGKPGRDRWSADRCRFAIARRNGDCDATSLHADDGPGAFLWSGRCQSPGQVPGAPDSVAFDRVSGRHHNGEHRVKRRGLAQTNYRNRRSDQQIGDADSCERWGYQCSNHARLMDCAVNRAGDSRGERLLREPAVEPGRESRGEIRRRSGGSERDGGKCGAGLELQPSLVRARRNLGNGNWGTRTFPIFLLSRLVTEIIAPCDLRPCAPQLTKQILAKAKACEHESGDKT